MSAPDTNRLSTSGRVPWVHAAWRVCPKRGPFWEPHGNWKDELNRVIKGRGLEFPDAYRAIRRDGREGIQLHGNRRKFLWDNWYEPYRARMKEKCAHDFNDVIRGRGIAGPAARRYRGLRDGRRR
jgi:hypothetical protein